MIGSYRLRLVYRALTSGLTVSNRAHPANRTGRKPPQPFPAADSPPPRETCPAIAHDLLTTARRAGQPPLPASPIPPALRQRLQRPAQRRRGTSGTLRTRHSPTSESHTAPRRTESRGTDTGRGLRRYGTYRAPVNGPGLNTRQLTPSRAGIFASNVTKVKPAAVPRFGELNGPSVNACHASGSSFGSARRPFAGPIAARDTPATHRLAS
jgi:hypothetical protein